MEWSTVVSKGLFVPQHDFDIPSNIVRDFTYLTQGALGETGCCKCVMCSLLMCPKIKDFHSGGVGLVLFSFLNRKFMYEVPEKAAPESFTEHSSCIFL